MWCVICWFASGGQVVWRSGLTKESAEALAFRLTNYSERCDLKGARMAFRAEEE